jgi:tRNA-splicing ligase RtcB
VLAGLVVITDGMMAVQTTLTANDLPDNLAPMRNTIERAVPHGRGKHGGKGDKSSWDAIPNRVVHHARKHRTERARQPAAVDASHLTQPRLCTELGT